MEKSRYLKRDIDQRLVRWTKAPQRKPLILRGARQVGKTECVHHLSETTFKSFVEVNFERQRDYRKVFSLNFNVERVISELSALTGKEINPGETLLFFDEIQECPEAITCLRYFYEEMPELHVIAAGSLLEFVLEKISVPVGRVTYDYLYPLSFAEFLGAMEGENWRTYLPVLDETLQSPPSQAITSKLHTVLKNYFLVGGLPAAVRMFKETSSYLDTAKVLDDLMLSFNADVQKYLKGDKQITSALRILTRVMKFVGKQVKYTELGDGDDIKRTKNALLALEQAGLVHLIRSTQPGFPLGAEASDKHFKLVFVDIGLGQRILGTPAQEVLQSTNLMGNYEGKLAEQFVGQQLISAFAQKSGVYCWIRGEKGSEAEVDYLITNSTGVVPIEVKSGKSGTLKSLRMLMEKCGLKGICLQDRGDVFLDEKGVKFMPLYSINKTE